MQLYKREVKFRVISLFRMCSLYQEKSIITLYIYTCTKWLYACHLVKDTTKWGPPVTIWPLTVQDATTAQVCPRFYILCVGERRTFLCMHKHLRHTVRTQTYGNVLQRVSTNVKISPYAERTLRPFVIV